MPNRAIFKDRGIGGLPGFASTRETFSRRSSRAFRGIPNPTMSLPAIYETTAALKEMVEVITRQRGFVDDSAIFVNEFEEAIHGIENQLSGVNDRLDILEQIIVQLVPAGYANAVQETDVPFDITGGWSALPIELSSLLENKGVNFDFGMNTFTFSFPGVWQLSTGFSIQGHNSSNGGRAIGVRLTNIDTGASSIGAVVGVGRNVTDSFFSASVMRDITENTLGNSFQIEVGGFDSVTGGTLIGSSIALVHVSELATLATSPIA